MSAGTGNPGFTQPADFREESEALHSFLDPLREEDFARPTRFKQWTIDEILTHLHIWNWAAEQTLVDEPALVRLVDDFISKRESTTLRAWEKNQVGPLRGRTLLAAWREQSLKVAERFEGVDPRRRTKWFGPDLSARSNITARQMETWAHGQAIYDLLGVERTDTDRIRNIAVLGVNTFGWSFAVHQQELPAVPPYVCLTAPSGAIWTWNEASEVERIEGSATTFCQVVTQTRNVADTKLKVTGTGARRWMSIAQCFAGLPQAPPAPGQRAREPAQARRTLGLQD